MSKTPEQVISEFLDPAEKVVWAGQPGRSITRGMLFYLGVLGLFWGFLLFMLYINYTGTNKPSFLLFVSGIVGISILGLLTSLTLYVYFKFFRKIYYGLTNERVLSVRLTKNTNPSLFCLSDIKTVEIKEEKGGHGSITFFFKQQDNEPVKSMDFLSIDHVREVYNLIHKTWTALSK